MFPPVTTRIQSRQMTPHRMCMAVWVRIMWRRRPSSTSPVTVVPTSGIGPASVWSTRSPSERTSSTAVAPVAHTRCPVSWGWPPLVA